jgi:CheY-like chemotaxis protein
MNVQLPEAAGAGSYGLPAEDLERSMRLARVLIVDDHAASRRLCAAFCDLFHFACESVRSGAEAIQALRESPFDVVLMDIHMPGEGGVETARAIRALPGPAGRTPIIAVTTDAGREESDRYRANGMADVVAKPITPARLYKAISAAVGLPDREPRTWARAEA